MKTLFRIALVIALTSLGLLRGQTHEDPITVPLRVYLNWGSPNPGGNQEAICSLSLSNFYFNFVQSPFGPTSVAGAQSGFAYLVPGRNYTMSMLAQRINYAYEVYLAPPTGHRLLIDDVEQLAYKLTVNPVGTVSKNSTVRVESLAVTPIAESMPIRPGRLVWGVGLGLLKNGASAGALQMRVQNTTALSADDFKVSSLFWSSISPEVTAYYSTVATNTYQLFTNQALIQVQPLTAPSEGYQIHFYDRSQVSTTLQNGMWVINSGETPRIEYKVENVTPGSYGTSSAILFTRTNRINSPGKAGVRVTYARLGMVSGQPAGTTKWKVVDWTTNQPAGTDKYLVAGDSYSEWTYTNNALIEDIEVFSGSGIKASATRNIYSQFAWGTELTEKIEGYGSTLPQSTTYGYYTNSGLLGEYSQLKYTIEPTGKWEMHQYYNDYARLGLLAKTYRPYGDTGTSPTAPDYANGHVVEMDYALDQTGIRRTRPSSVVTKINGTVTGRVETTYVDSTVSETAYATNGTSYVVQRPIVIATTQTYNSASAFVTSISEAYREDAGMGLLPNGLYEDVKGFLANKPRRTVAPDKVTQKFTYQRANQSAWYWSYTPSAQGGDWVTTREISGDGVLKDGGSTLTEEVRRADGLLILTSDYVRSDSAWKCIKQLRFLGLSLRPDSVEMSSGSQFNSWYVDRTVWEGGLAVSKTDVSGITKTYTYKGNGMVATEALSAAASAPVQVASALPVTVYFYDGEGQITTVRKQSSVNTSSDDFVSTTTYDWAGRKTSESSTSPTGTVTTTFEHKYGGEFRNLRVINPNNADVIQTTYLDGKLKSEFGSAVYGLSKQKVYTYGVDTSGNTWSKTSYPWGAYDYEISDWAGRRILTTTTGYLGARVATVFEYEPTTGRLRRSQVVGASATDAASFGSTPFQSPVYREYDDLSRVETEWVDTNENGNLDPASDLITETEILIESAAASFSIAEGPTPSISYPASQTPTIHWELTRKKTYIGGSSDPTTVAATLKALNSFTVFATVNSVQSTLIVSQTKTRNALNTSSDAPDTTSYGSTEINPTLARVDVRGKAAAVGNWSRVSSVNGFTFEELSVEGNRTTKTYDAYGRLAEVKGRDVVTENYAYYPGTSAVRYVNNAVLNPTSLGGANLRTIYYDNMGRTVRTTVFDTGNWVDTFAGYDERGNLRFQWGNGTNPVEFEYDEYNRKISNKYFRDTSTNWNSSTWPGSASTADVTIWVYDPVSGLLTEKKYPSSTNGAGQAVATTAVKTEYSPDGKITLRTWGSGLRTQYSYYGVSAEGQRGALWKVEYPNSGSVRQSIATPTVFYKYTRNGLISEVTDGSGTRTFSYRSSDLQPEKEDLTATVYGSKVIKVSYDNAGRASGYKLGTPTQISSNLWTDALQAVSWEGTVSSATGRITTISSYNSTTGQTRGFTYGYKAGSNLIETVTSGTSFQRTHVWQSWRNVADVVQTYAGGTQIAEFSYNYDWLGRVIDQKVRGDLSKKWDSNQQNGYKKNYLYTSKGELDSASAFWLDANGNQTGTALPGTADATHQHDWVYDSQGNPTRDYPNGAQLDYTINSLNQIVKKGASNLLLYDDDGNLTNDGTWQYFWDAENRLAEMRELVGGTSARTLTFEYDYLNRRVSKSVGPTNNSQNRVVTRFVWKGWDLIAEFNAATPNTMDRLYTWGIDIAGGSAGGVGGMLMASQREYYTGSLASKDLMPVYDHNGNIHGYVDQNGASGSLVGAVDLTAFGERRVKWGAYMMPFQFASKYVDEETGLVQYNNRFYSPTLGRFLNRDLVGERGGLNLYGYCGNDGINRWDYLGNSWLSKTFKKIGSWFKQNFTAVIGAALSVLCPPLGVAYNMTLGYINGGIKGMIIGFASSIIAGGFGDASRLASAGIKLGEKLGSGLVGNIVQGGINGALAGGVAASLTGQNVLDGMLAGAISGAVIGGLAHGFNKGIPESWRKAVGDLPLMGRLRDATQKLGSWQKGAQDTVSKVMKNTISAVTTGAKSLIDWFTPSMAANSGQISPVEGGASGGNISQAEAIEKMRLAMGLVEKYAPSARAKLLDALKNGKVSVTTVASFRFEVENSATGVKEYRTGGGGLISGLNPPILVLVINSGTSINQLASVLVHEITHIGQDPSLSSLQRELPAYRAQYEFMKAVGMPMDSLAQYGNNGGWSDELFTKIYTANSITTPEGGTWQQTGHVEIVKNL